jgi:1-pyrroline-5-carboxylate dehydrogenase
MQAALAQVRAQLSREYDLLVDGGPLKTEQKLTSVNPARPEEIVGVHQKATPELAARAVESLHAFFPEWSRTPPFRRVELAIQTAAILRRRKLEFDAWLVYEAGKTWPEADADVSEAIDFCE